MAVTGKRGVGIPTILLHDGEGTIVSIELKSGETYRGFLDETEDNMNCVLKDAVRTELNGSTTHVEQVYLRGSHIMFIVFPDIYPLHHALHVAAGAVVYCILRPWPCVHVCSLVLLGTVSVLLNPWIEMACCYVSFWWLCTLKHAPMFKRMKLWKKHKGSIPALGQGGGGGGPRGQAAAIMRKGNSFHSAWSS